MTLNIYWNSFSKVKHVCEPFDIVRGFRQTSLYSTTFVPSSRQIFCERSSSQWHYFEQERPEALIHQPEICWEDFFTFFKANILWKEFITMTLFWTRASRSLDTPARNLLRGLFYLLRGKYSVKGVHHNDTILNKSVQQLGYTNPINLLRGNLQRNSFFFCILFWCLACGSKPDFTSNKPKHYLLVYYQFSLVTESTKFAVKIYIVMMLLF